MTIPFEVPLTLEINGQKVELYCFETVEHGNIKFGVNAPRCLNVNREEIHLMKIENNKTIR